MSKNTWTIVEEIKALDLHDRGYSDFKIAQVLGRSEHSTINKMNHLIVHGITVPPQIRKCGCCFNDFPSESRFNRICGTCKVLHMADSDVSAGRLALSV